MRNKAIKPTLVLLLVVLTFQLKAQTVLEATLTNETFIMETWWTRPLDQAYQFVLFNLNTAEYHFDLDQTTLMSYSILNIDLWKGIGPVVGSRLLKDRVVGLAGLQYTYFKKQLFITTNFTTEMKEKPDFEFYSLAQYRPKINKKLNAFLQAQLSFNFNSNQHLFSFQQIRLGADFGLIQSGFALNLYQLGQDWQHQIHPGLFLRLDFK